MRQPDGWVCSPLRVDPNPPTRWLRSPLDPFVKGKVMRHKHQPYRRNDGFWSCSVCKWKFASKPSADNCPGVLRIECANDEYKTAAQWRKLGFEPVDIGDADAVSHGHSSKWHYYYRRDHVRGLTQLAPDAGESAASSDILPASEVSASEAESKPATTQVM